MFPGVTKTGLTLPKVIGGISKTLNVANQIIPLYLEAKPMIQNAKNAFSVAKEFMATPKETPKKNTTPQKNKIEYTSKNEKKVVPKTTQTSTNNPVFFL